MPQIETSPVGMVYDCFFGANGWLYIAALIDPSLEAVDYLIRAEVSHAVGRLQALADRSPAAARA